MLAVTQQGRGTGDGDTPDAVVPVILRAALGVA